MRRGGRIAGLVASVAAVVCLLASGAAGQDAELTVADVDTSGFPEVVLRVELAGQLAGVALDRVDVELIEGLTRQPATVVQADADADAWTLTYTSDGTGPTAVLLRVGPGGSVATVSTEIVLPDRAHEPDAAVGDDQSATVRIDSASGTSTLVITGDDGTGDPVFWLGIGALFAALLLGGLILFGPAASRLGSGPPPRGPGRSLIGGVAAGATDAARRLADRLAGLSANRLEEAGVAMSSGELVLVTLGIAVGAALLGTLLNGLLGGIVLVGLVAAAAWGWLSHQVGRRQRAFARQLPATLQLLATNLRAGHGTVRSLELVADAVETPTADELDRVLTEHRLGGDLDDSLAAMASRMGSDEFGWVVQAMAINRDLGGDLAAVLDNVTATIAEREHIRTRIAALSADGRLSAYVLVALPFAVAIVFQLVDPDHLGELWDRGAGRMVLVGAALLLGVGWLWLRRMIRLVV